MKKNVFLSIGLMLFVAFGLILFTAQTNHGEVIKRALPQIKKEVDADLLNLEKQAQYFNTYINSKKNDLYTKEDRIAFLELRKSFKTIAFIIEYWDKEFYDLRLNGAPLPKLTPKDTEVRILSPKGMQMIDEIIFDEYSTENHQKLKRLTSLLQHDIEQFIKTFDSKKLTQRNIFEAVRYNIIRQATLSITGFDTPGSVNGLNDCMVEIQSIQKYMHYFDDELKYNQSQELSNQFYLKSQNAYEFIKQNNDFETFDRFYFIQNYTNSLYEIVKDIHYNLSYETWDELDKDFAYSLNYEANNLFDSDFLNAFSYVSQKKDALYQKRKALGKLLFYDPIFSKNNQMACVSCHHPDKAFSDGLAKSISIDGKNFLSRNSMTLPYSVYAKKMFWDMRVEGLENQFEHVVTNELEFHSDYTEVLRKLNQSQKYQAYFAEAFPDYPQPIIINAIDYALAAYVMSLGDFSSKFDMAMRGKTSLNNKEKKGFNLFAGKAACATCHFIPTFNGLVPPFYTESESEVLGVTSKETAPWELDVDLGRFDGLIKESAEFYQHSFKTVTVRNIEKTAPYMHNGAFTTLESVMDFYNDGGGAGRGLNVKHQTLAPDALKLTEEEINDIIAFLKSLTDHQNIKAITNQEIPRDFDNEILNKRQVPFAVQ